MPKLAVLQTLVQAVGTVWRERGDFFRIGVIPAVAIAFGVIGMQIVQLSVLSDYGVNLSENASIADFQKLAAQIANESSRIFAVSVLFAIFSFLVVSVFSCAWHFRILRPTESRTVREALRFDAAKGRFVLVAVTLVVMWMVVLFIASTAIWTLAVSLNLVGAIPAVILLLLPYGIATYVVLRFAMVLPAAAVGDKLSLPESWRMTKGNGIRLLSLAITALIALTLSMVVVLAPVVAILSLLSFIVPGILTTMLLMQLVFGAVFIMGNSVWVTALSISYAQFAQPSNRSPGDGWGSE